MSSSSNTPISEMPPVKHAVTVGQHVYLFKNNGQDNKLRAAIDIVHTKRNYDYASKVDGLMQEYGFTPGSVKTDAKRGG